MEPEAALRPGAVLRGFEVQAVTALPELRAVAYRLDHLASGARLLHVHADDPENLFSVTFPTLPADDTGAPHILEHSVLGGSRKYPVRQPFFEMLKMSMGTYINAFTATDYTSYPVASTVRQDLFNLADVYFDAVFHPLLTEETFRREGHRLAPADPRSPTGPLTVTGIVYNEMKGYYSRPDVRLWIEAEAALLPETVYARSSGGRPDAIPDLTYEGLRRFYETYYHPSNAYFFLYGDIPTVDHLTFLEERLAEFRRRPVEARIARQPRWQAPRQAEREYQLGDGEREAEKTYLLLQWLAGTASDPQDAVTLEVLEHLLLGHEAAPLRKALVDSRLGQDLTHAGWNSAGAEALFQVGLKGSEPDRAERFEQLVLDTLAAFAERGVPPQHVRAAFHQAAYHHLEILPMFPLHLRARVVEAWRLGADPYTFVRMRQHLNACRARWEADPRYFQHFVRDRLLDNPHRLRLVLRPSRDYQARLESAFAERMRRLRAGMSDDEARRLAERSAEVERQAAAPNPPEAVARLPQLRVADVPRRPRHIPTSVEEVAGIPVLRNDVFTNGVNYLVLDLDVADLTAERWPYVPRYAEAIAKFGAAGYSYEEMAHRVAAATGGIQAWPALGRRAAPRREGLRRMRLSLKALDEQVPDALEVLTDLLLAVDPHDRERLSVVLAQALAGTRTGLVNGGTGTALRHAARGLAPEDHLEELMHGVSQLRLLERLNGGGAAPETVMQEVERIRDSLLQRGRLTVSFTGADAAYDALRAAVRRWADRMRGGAAGDLAAAPPPRRPPREGLAAPIDVAYCALVMPAPHYADPSSAMLSVGAHLVTSEYVLPEIRFRGAAYGGSCSYEPLEGRLALLSWQDPGPARTLGVFSHLREYVAGAGWSQADVDRAIIGTLRDAERPVRPGPATHTALARHVAGLTPEMRDARHQEILAATPERVKRALLEALDAGLPASRTCVLAGSRMLADANRELGDAPLEVSPLLGAAPGDTNEGPPPLS